MLGLEYYVGAGYGQIYQDLVEIIKLECSVADRDMFFEGSIGITLDGLVTREITLNGRIN